MAQSPPSSKVVTSSRRRRRLRGLLQSLLAGFIPAPALRERSAGLTSALQAPTVAARVASNVPKKAGWLAGLVGLLSEWTSVLRYDSSGRPWRVLQNPRTSAEAGLPGLAAALATLALAALAGVACSSPVAELRIKGPRDAIEATAATPTFPIFDRIGEAIHLRASAFDARGLFLGPATVEWSSSAPDIATVSPEGVVTVVSSGDFVITARARESSLEVSQALIAIIERTIRIVPPEVKASGAGSRSATRRARANMLELPLGETMQMRAEVLDDRGRVIDGARVRWRTTTFAATVTPDGELEGRAIGAVQVVAESRAGHLARLDLSVVDWPRTRRRSG